MAGHLQCVRARAGQQGALRPGRRGQRLLAARRERPCARDVPAEHRRPDVFELIPGCEHPVEWHGVARHTAVATIAL
jgi:hypothetical protein